MKIRIKPHSLSLQYSVLYLKSVLAVGFLSNVCHVKDGNDLWSYCESQVTYRYWLEHCYRSFPISHSRILVNTAADILLIEYMLISRNGRWLTASNFPLMTFMEDVFVLCGSTQFPIRLRPWPFGNLRHLYCLVNRKRPKKRGKNSMCRKYGLLFLSVSFFLFFLYKKLIWIYQFIILFLLCLICVG